jgi:CelD/BcsL family acetyltransferase involved in cellulose biosynthesis/GNAT superfamily N-acetyltransferase
MQDNCIEIDLIDKPEEFYRLEDEWNGLLEKADIKEVFLRHEWFRCWWEAFGEGKGLFVLKIKCSDETIAFAPLMLVREPYRNTMLKKIKFISNEHSSRCDFIAKEPASPMFDAVIRYLSGRRELWDIIELDNMPGASPTIEHLKQSLKSSGVTYGIKKGLSSPYIAIDTNWDIFFRNRSSRFRKNLRTKTNRLNKAGEYTVEEIKDDYGILDTVFGISEKSWKASLGQAITQSSRVKKFFEKLTDTAIREGWLGVWIININGVPAAYEYHLKYNNRVSGLRSGYDEEYKGLSPGSVLDRHIVENTFKQGFSEYDFGGGSDFYKFSWTSSIRDHYNIVIFSGNIKSRLVYIKEFVVISWIKKIVSPVRNMFRKSREIYKYQGPGKLLGRVVKKVLNFIFSCNSAVWFEKNIETELEKYDPKIQIEINMDSGKNTIEWLNGLNIIWLVNPKEIEFCIAHNHYLPAALHDRNIVGCAKVGFDKVYILDFRKAIKFPEDMIFIYDTYVAPEYRGKGIAGYIIYEISKYFRNKGYKRIRCHIPKWNTASVSAYRKAGFKEIKIIRCFRILGLPIITSDPSGY